MNFQLLRTAHKLLLYLLLYLFFPAIVFSQQQTTVTQLWDGTSSVFSIFPNPAKDVLLINGKNLTEVKITDNTGRIVTTQILNNANNARINISGLSKGLYIVQIKDNKNNIQTEKIVVQ